MSPRKTPLMNRAVLFTVFLLVAPQGLAGEHVRAGKMSVIRSQPGSPPLAPAVPRTESVSLVVLATVPATTAPAYVDIRGPDGQVRHFPVEGGRAAIQYRQVTLHAGEMLTIHWTAAK